MHVCKSREEAQKILKKATKDQREIDNWKKVKKALEDAGKTDCHFYQRAVSICKGNKDPGIGLPEIKTDL